MYLSKLPDWLETIHHDGSYVSDLYPRLGARVTLRLRTHIDAPVRKLYLRTFPDGEQAFAPLTRAARAGHVQWWQGELAIDEPQVHYRFLIDAEDGLWWLTAKGVLQQEPLDAFDFRIIADYQPPPLLKGAVFYQIFPDRFANGDSSNDITPAAYEYRGYRPRTYGWGEPPDPQQPFAITFYGGDLPGITQRLDYLVQLGVSALYLNPVFTAYSNHKYDVIDYEHVDPYLGGDAALAALRQALDARGMHYLLDIVPNHAGFWHPWFQTARDNPTAPERDFFTFGDGPDDYASWLGVWTLPKLNYNSAELRRRIYGAPDSVFRRWLRPPYAADGWRVDVANMLGRQGPTQLGAQISREIRAAVKATNPDAYLLGENFFDATAQLQGDQYDGVMNYMGFNHPLLYWLRGQALRAHGLHETIASSTPYPTAALIATWTERMAVVPWQLTLQQFNLLGSHDTPRIRSLVNGDDALHRMAVMLLLTYPGVASLYYGDEIGLVDDPLLHQRGCMRWEEADWDHDLLAFHRVLIALRRTSPALDRGGFQWLASGPAWFAYVREAAEQWVIVVANRGATLAEGRLSLAHTAIPDGTLFKDLFSAARYHVAGQALTLPGLPRGGLVLVSDRD